jgi:predicted Zn-dependent protease with MMP-like domain
LGALGQLDEASQAFARALAVDPDSVDGLAGAARLYSGLMPSTRENDELGLLYSERGLELTLAEHDIEFIIAFERLSAAAFNDLGRPRQALERAQSLLRRRPADSDGRYESAVALFELGRYVEATKMFSSLLDDKGFVAYAHHHLGLLAERAGEFDRANHHFGRARELAPSAFAQPILLPQREFEAAVREALAELPADMREDLSGIPVTTADIPKDADLRVGETPLSPTILGLFRGPSLDESCEGLLTRPCRSVVVYRRNLARTAKTKDELITQLRVTLLHEVGHLRGEEDEELAARGLE